MRSREIHPKTPPRLAARFRKAGSYHKLAEELKVNVYWLHRLIVHGIEPSDSTENGRELRKKLFLPRHVRRGEQKRTQPMPDYLRWWKQQDRRTIIKQLYELNGKEKP